MTIKSKLMLGAVCAPLAFMAVSAASAQESANPAQSDDAAMPVDRVVITGSYIRGRGEDGALPVDVFGAQELDNRGIDSPLEFMKTLPSVGPVLGDSNQFAAGTEQGVGSINLRSLGRERTLVLFNGRRTISSPGTGSTDTNLIPFFAVQRVEVLKDGAASTYGSDAIAGVANFVTYNAFEGVEVSGSYNFIDGSDGNYQASVLAGERFGNVDVMVGAGWQRRNELPNTERAFTQTEYDVNPTGYSFLSNPGTYLPIIPGFGVVGIGIDGQQLDTCTAMGGIQGTFPTSPTSAFPVCRYSYVDFSNLVEEEDRYQIYGQIDVDLGPNTTFHAEAIYAGMEMIDYAGSPSYPPVQGPLGPGSANAFSVPASNPGYAAYLAQTFPAGSPAYLSSLSNILFFRPFALGGNPLDERGAGLGSAENEAWRIAGGFEHDFSDNFGAQLYATYIHSNRKNAVRDFVGDRLQRAINGFGGASCSGSTPGANGCQYFNPFINSAPGHPTLGLTNPAFVPGNENDPALIEWMYQPSGTDQTEDQFIVDLIFSGYDTLFGQEVDYAFGAQYRRTEYESLPANVFSDPVGFPCAIEGDRSCLDDPNDANLPTGPFIFLGQYSTVNVEQDVYALFAEAQIEPFDGFELTGAVRYEDYGNPVGSTFNPKISARWQVSDNVALRASVGDTFRAPLPSDLEGDGLTLVEGIDAAGGAFKANQIAGNPDLDPETAFTYNFGILFESGGFSASVDFWNYDFEGRFTELPVQAIASAVAPGPVTDGTQAVDCASPFTEFVVFAGGSCTAGTTANDISRILVQVVNGPDVTTNGLDFSLNYRGDVGPFDFSGGVNATYTAKYEFGEFVYEGLTFDGSYDAAGFANYDRAPGTVSPWRASGFASFTYGRYNATYSLTYIDGVDDNRCPDTGACTQTPEFGPTDFGRTVESYTQHDLLGTVDLAAFGADVQLQAGVENIFDTDPPAARLELSYDPYVGNPLGRVYRLGLTARF